MTTKLQKLDVFVIEDNINCTVSELNARAEAIADDISAKNGWKFTHVHLVSPNPQEKNGFLRYEFEILGIPNKGLSTGDIQTTEYSTEKQKAATPLEIDGGV